ncbi:4-alpha-glucanotransferase, partial [Streptomyces sp. NPDC005568]|uniref:4-alpha-glucanotransferase n=1 Tax=Streptomyces sp. NPDC005568 TaxID=3156887 RepID=UPI0033BCFDDA
MAPSPPAESAEWPPSGAAPARPAESAGTPLSRLAALHGVATSYSPSPDRTVPASDTAVTAALAALGVDASTPQAVLTALAAREAELRERLLPPTIVSWGGDLPAALAGLPDGTRLRVETEQGDTRDSAAHLAPGVHTLHAQAPDGRTADVHLVVAPDRLPAPPGRTHGLLVQLYSLLSRRSWGMGDLGDLRELATWAGRALGAGFVQLNPLHAAVPGAPTDPSPYRPSSRRFPDPVHLRVEDVPEFAYAEDRERLDALRLRAAELRDTVLNKGALIDRDAVWELKRAALELIRTVPLGPGRRAALDDFVAEEGAALEDRGSRRQSPRAASSSTSTWPARTRTSPAGTC